MMSMFGRLTRYISTFVMGSLDNLGLGRGGGARFIIDENGFRRMSTAIQALPVNLKKNTQQSAVRAVGTIGRLAASNFHGSIRRPGEQGEGTERGRKTGKFTFGNKDSGAAFHGSVFEVNKGLFGFGYPFIPHADARTDYVWRSLEYGLPGTRNAATTLLGDASLFPKGEHKLPRRFYFSTPSPSSAILVIPKKFARKGSQKQKILKGGSSNPGAGFEGKHFIEEAWIEMREKLPEKWRQDIVATVATFGRSV